MVPPALPQRWPWVGLGLWCLSSPALQAAWQSTEQCAPSAIVLAALTEDTPRWACFGTHDIPLAEAEGGGPWGRDGLAGERGGKPSWEMKREPQTSLLCGRWPRLWFTVQIWELARAVLILHEAVRGPQAWNWSSGLEWNWTVGLVLKGHDVLPEVCAALFPSNAVYYICTQCPRRV